MIEVYRIMTGIDGDQLVNVSFKGTNEGSSGKQSMSHLRASMKVQAEQEEAILHTTSIRNVELLVKESRQGFKFIQAQGETEQAYAIEFR